MEILVWGIDENVLTVGNRRTRSLPLPLPATLISHWIA